MEKCLRKAVGLALLTCAVGLVLSACAAKGLKATGYVYEQTDNSWIISADTMDGSMGGSFKRAGGSPKMLKVNSSVGSGVLVMTLGRGAKIVEIPVGSCELSLEDWGDGQMDVRIVCDEAEDVSINIEWS